MKRVRAALPSPRRGLTMLALLVSACGTPGAELFVRTPPLRGADAVVVLGNRPARTAGGEVAPETARRVRRGVELFERGLAPLLVLSGGSTRGETEAEVMGAYARALGVPEEAIRLEARSQDTADNARLTVELLCAGRDACAPRVIGVSSPHHLRRAWRLFECAGAEVQGAASALPDDVSGRLASAVYEYAVRMAYVFYDACGRAAGR